MCAAVEVWHACVTQHLKRNSATAVCKDGTRLEATFSVDFAAVDDEDSNTAVLLTHRAGYTFASTQLVVGRFVGFLPVGHAVTTSLVALQRCFSGSGRLFFPAYTDVF